jgi:hypothetical protein
MDPAITKRFRRYDNGQTRINLFIHLQRSGGEFDVQTAVPCV